MTNCWNKVMFHCGGKWKVKRESGSTISDAKNETIWISSKPL